MLWMALDVEQVGKTGRFSNLNLRDDVSDQEEILNEAGPANAAGRAGWRREWDSNPRYALTYTRFPSVRLKPLGHLSVQTNC